LLYWLIGLGSLLWLALRSGTDPRRLAYPCQRAALATSAGLAVYVLSGLGVTQLYRRLRQRPALSTLGLFLLMLMFASVMSGSITPPYLSRAASPSLPAWTSASAKSDVFAVTNVPAPECSLDGGNLPATPPCNAQAFALRDQGVDALIDSMDSKGAYFYKTTAHPNGVVGKNDVVVIKVNNQWGGEGNGAGTGRMATNTDVLKGLIWKVLQHPDDFTGEVVVAENGQWWPKSWDVTLANAEDQYQSIQDVVGAFQSLGYTVSLFDWSDLNASRINGGSITNLGYPAGEYISGNNSDAYILLEDPAGSGTNELSYPKFQTANGNRVSMRYGVWNGSSYNSDQLTFINLPVLKKHGMAGATIAWKNLIGFVTAEPIGSTDRYGDWNAMHDFYWGYTGDANRNYGLLGREIALVRAPDLNLVDAIWVAYEANTGGQAIRQDVLLASTDPFAVDWYASEHVLRPAVPDSPQDSSAARGGTFRDATRVNQNAAAFVWPGGSANYPYIDLLDGYDGSTPSDDEKNQMNAYVADAVAPALALEPAVLGVGLDANNTAIRVLTLSNVGGVALTWNLTENPARSWLSESLTGGTLAPSASMPVTLTFNTAGMSRGAYVTTLQIGGDASAHIPVTLIVDPYRVYLPMIQK
jgi:hypothetical protein